MAEETILTGDDLMMGPPSPCVPPELASHVLDGIESCSTSLRRLFHCECFSAEIPCYFSTFLVLGSTRTLLSSQNGLSWRNFFSLFLSS